MSVSVCGCFEFVDHRGKVHIRRGRHLTIFFVSTVEPRLFGLPIIQNLDYPAWQISQIQKMAMSLNAPCVMQLLLYGDRPAYLLCMRRQPWHVAQIVFKATN